MDANIRMADPADPRFRDQVYLASPAQIAGWGGDGSTSVRPGAVQTRRPGYDETR